MIVNVPVGEEPAVSTTGVLVIVAVGDTDTVTLVSLASVPLVAIVKFAEATPAVPVAEPAVSVNADAAPYDIVAVCEVPPGPVTVTVTVPLPLLGVVSVNGVPLVGVVVLSVPTVVDAESEPEPPVSVAVIDAAVLFAADCEPGDTASEYAV